jgi:manganese transport protein
MNEMPSSVNDARQPTLAGAANSVPVPKGGPFWRKLLAFSGPGYLDPGNWATDLAGGSKFGYTLLSVILLSNLMAILLQSLCARLGIATGRDLAQSCRDRFPRPVSFGLWVLAELAICATDLAEVIGSAIALNLLFGLPISWGVCITVLDVFVILLLERRGFRYLEAFVIALILIIALCFGLEIVFSQPSVVAIMGGFVPTLEIVRNPEMLFIAIGILGATVMPHNLYLHSSLVQTRAYERTLPGKREAIRFATIDSTVALMFALLVNAAILIVAAAVFHEQGKHEVAEIQQAYHLLSPMLGVTGASTLFAIALLASGQNSTLTGTIAGQIVMEGFLHIKLAPWLRRLITRGIAVIPALIVSLKYGESGTAKLLVISQVILSLQLSFAVVPLVIFTGHRASMGEFTAPRWVLVLAWATAAIIIGLNVKFLCDYFGLG